MEQQQHFLFVTYPAQGHINPARHLARRLARSTGAAVTLSTSVSGHRRMFPDAATTNPDEPASDGLLSYIPFSDGYDDGFKSGTDDPKHFMTQFKLNGAKNLAAIIDGLAARGRRVTCVIYTLLLSWAGDVARGRGIPSALYWIQPSTVLAIYYHYFHGHQSLIVSHGSDPTFTVDLPGLPPLQIRDLPSFLTIADSDDPYSIVLTTFGETFEALDRDDTWPKPKVLVNSSEELEPDAVAAVRGKLELIPVGPVLPSTDQKEAGSGDLFKPDEKGYMEWLDSKPERSVVYVSFGSLSVVKKEQMEEMLKGLKESGRAYLWVVRKDSRWEGVELEEEGGDGMAVEWCSQVRVLSHPSVGCFVTHCGWNSTLESLVCGVPTVGVPQWTDQGTNARLVEKAWGTGVRVEVNGEGLVEGGELARCLEVVMGEGERGREIRENAEMWRDKAREAAGEGGSSDRNLRAFIAEIADY